MSTAIKVVTATGLAVLALVCSAAAADRPARVTTVFQVEGMHCGGCSSAIVGALERIDGVESATADHEKGVATAVYRPAKVEAEELKAAIEKLGYKVVGQKTTDLE